MIVINVQGIKSCLGFLGVSRKHFCELIDFDLISATNDFSVQTIKISPNLASRIEFVLDSLNCEFIDNRI